MQHIFFVYESRILQVRLKAYLNCSSDLKNCQILLIMEAIWEVESFFEIPSMDD